jgi:D-alanyl-D-alanine carboxypeptidase
MLSSAPDLLRYARALRDGELLEPATHRLMFTYYPPAGGGSPNRQYMLGISRSERAYGDFASVGHGGGTLGFSARMIWFEGTDVIIILLTNIGSMHSGLSPSPVSLFFNHVLVPAVMEYVGVE